LYFHSLKNSNPKREVECERRFEKKRSFWQKLSHTFRSSRWYADGTDGTVVEAAEIVLKNWEILNKIGISLMEMERVEYINFFPHR